MPTRLRVGTVLGFNMQKISACVVVYNEEQLIGRCLSSIKELVDEIVLVHDGECIDNTLKIAEKYTDRIFIRPHIGIAEPHRSFSYREAHYEWILQLDADEFFAPGDIEKIKMLLKNPTADGYWLEWEMWNGKEPVYIKGFKKLILFKKEKASNLGIPQQAVVVHGKTKDVDIRIRHRPLYDNISWKSFLRKMDYWLKANVKYYFPELVVYDCFNTTIDSWIVYTERVRKYPVFFLIFYPLKNLIGQLKNGLWKSTLGINLAFQQYVYYFSLYLGIWKMKRKLKSR